MNMNQLRINRLAVSNFRCFGKKEVALTFAPGLTVLVARNGEGKTAILDAVKVAFGTFTNAFPISACAHFHVADVHLEAVDINSAGPVYPVSLSAEGMVAGEVVRWRRELKKAKGRTTIKDAAPVSRFGEKLRKAIDEGDEPVALPLLAFYGTGRLWAEHKDMDSGAISPLAQNRFAGYENALSARSTYKQVKNWLMEALKFEDSKTASETQIGKLVVPQLKAIEKALSLVLGCEGFEQLHYNPFFKDDISVQQRRPGKDERPVDSLALPVSWLSDGVRAVFSMVADIAYRCVKLNPHLGVEACEQTSGIVLIDEVDIFLHPAWQQHVLQRLRQAFPNIQFIVTTHSPQVVSSVPRQSIRVISEGEILDASIETEGARAEQILEEVFGVEARPAESPVTKDLANYRRLIEEGKWDSREGVDLKRRLNRALSTDPVLSELAMTIHLKEYQRTCHEEN